MIWANKTKAHPSMVKISINGETSLSNRFKWWSGLLYMFHNTPNNGDGSWLSQAVSEGDNLKCHICGIMFATQQEKLQHMKLEHQKKEVPTGVG